MPIITFPFRTEQKQPVKAGTMIEVFKTNVEDHDLANMLLDQIHKTFIGYKANFDLQDCDNILRVKSATTAIQCDCLINLLKDFGFHAEVLPDVFGQDAQILFANLNNYTQSK